MRLGIFFVCFLIHLFYRMILRVTALLSPSATLKRIHFMCLYFFVRNVYSIMVDRRLCPLFTDNKRRGLFGVSSSLPLRFLRYRSQHGGSWPPSFFLFSFFERGRVPFPASFICYLSVTSCYRYLPVFPAPGFFLPHPGRYHEATGCGGRYNACPQRSSPISCRADTAFPEQAGNGHP